MRAAIYCRVSTADQNASNQLDQLRAWCATAGHVVVAEYADTESGGKGAADRAQLADMLAAADRGEFDVLAIWAVDRLSREGMAATLGYWSRLAKAGVVLHSYTEPAICSDNELVRDIVLAVMSALAKAERVRNSDRTKAGLERVRRNGSRSGRAIGRPAIDSDLVTRIRDMRRNNPKVRAYAIGKALGIDRKTVRKYLATAQIGEAEPAEMVAEPLQTAAQPLLNLA